MELKTRTQAPLCDNAGTRPHFIASTISRIPSAALTLTFDTSVATSGVDTLSQSSVNSSQSLHCVLP